MESYRFNWRKLEQITANGVAVVPVAVQDVESGDVLMVAYADRSAVRETIRRGRAVFWSTSRHMLHDKGATSGEVLELVEVLVNCEANSLLYRVRFRGSGACHVHTEEGPRRSCFYRPLSSVEVDGLAG